MPTYKLVPTAFVRSSLRTHRWPALRDSSLAGPVWLRFRNYIPDDRGTLWIDGDYSYNRLGLGLYRCVLAGTPLVVAKFTLSSWRPLDDRSEWASTYLLPGHCNLFPRYRPFAPADYWS